MKLIYTCDVFSFHDLKNYAKENAISKFCVPDDWYFEELEDTIKEFAAVFHVELNEYDCSGWYPVDFKISCELDDIKKLSGYRLVKAVNNRFYDYVFKPKYYSNLKKHRYSNMTKESNCPLTDICYDIDILTPVIDVLKFKHANDPCYDFEDMIYDCFYSWQKAAENEHIYRTSEEFFAEECIENEWFFAEDGLTRYQKIGCKILIA